MAPAPSPAVRVEQKKRDKRMKKIDEEIAAPADTMMFCLSKALGAPAGSARRTTTTNVT